MYPAKIMLHSFLSIDIFFKVGFSFRVATKRCFVDKKSSTVVSSSSVSVQAFGQRSMQEIWRIPLVHLHCLKHANDEYKT